jgi:hypothetical protein
MRTLSKAHLPHIQRKPIKHRNPKHSQYMENNNQRGHHACEYREAEKVGFEFLEHRMHGIGHRLRPH